MSGYRFEDLIDVPRLQALMDSFYRATSIPVGILDTRGDILVATGWQDICTKFHRVYPQTKALCKISDDYIKTNLRVGEYIEYKCQNHMWDLATPIIIKGQHIATLFLGQFFYDDEFVDADLFLKQARTHGFPEGEYMNALRKVPIFTRQKVKAIMDYYTNFVHSLIDTALTHEELNSYKANLEGLVDARTAELRKTMDALRESDERYREAFHASSAVKLLIDPETGKIVDANKAACAYYGFSPHELTSIYIHEINTLSPSQIQAEMEAAKNETRNYFLFRHRLASGEIRDVEVYSSPVKVGGKTLLHSIVHDISARKKVENALVESEKRFRHLAESAKDIIYSYRFYPEPHFEYVSPSVAAITGYAPEDHYGDPMLGMKIIHPDDRPVLEEIMRNGKVGGPLQIRWITKDGKTLWTEQSNVPILDDVGKVVGIHGVARDITERKRVEAERRSYIHYLNSLNRIYAAFEPALDLEIALPLALKEILSIFDSDRAFLLYPLDPEADAYKVPFEQTKPEYPGALKSNMELPITKDVKLLFSDALAARAPITMNLVEGVSDESRLKEFDIKTQLVVPLYPKVGKPWMLGLHQCSYVREWTKEEQGLFDAISQVISDKLSNLTLINNLRESEKRFRVTFEQAAVGVAQVSMEGRFIKINQRFCDIVGYTREEMMELAFQDITYPDDLETDLGNIKRILAGEIQTFSMEKRYIRKDGPIVWVNLTVSLAAKADGAPDYFIAVVEDISARKRAEQALKDSEKKLQLIVENAPFVVGVCDPHGKIYFINKRHEELFGYPLEKIPTIENWLKLAYPDDEYRKEVAAQWSDDIRKVQSGESQTGPTRLYRITAADGKVKDVEISFSLTGDYMYVLFYDVSELKLAQENLRKSKEAAENATKLKDKFVSLVSHDLKGPLISMLGLLNMVVVKDESLDENQKMGMIKASMSSGEKMLSLIEDLLGLSRFRAGSVKKEMAFLNSYIIAGNAIAVLREMGDRKGVSLINDIPVFSRIYADPTLLEEVLRNIVGNAIKFCHPGGKVRVFLPDGDLATIAVADDGVGIQPELLSKLFSYEEKISTLGTSGEMGTGLGLPLCMDMMETMGGKIRVESTAGEGSVFYVSLPYVRPVVMVVDDEPVQLLLITSMLNNLQADFVTAGSGAEALKALSEKTPNLVIVDIMMPGMDGFELMENIRKAPDGAKIPVILITSHGDIETRNTAFQKGANDFITKPLTADELIPRVRRFIW